MIKGNDINMLRKKVRSETGVSNLNYHDKPITSLDSLYQSFYFLNRFELKADFTI